MSVVFQLLGFGGEADHQAWAHVEVLGDGFENVGVLDEGNGEFVIHRLFLLLAGDILGAPVGDRGDADKHIAR